MQAPEPVRQRVCQRMKAERLRLGLSRMKVIAVLGVAHNTLRRWEADTPIPADHLSQLGELGYDTGFIVTGKVAAGCQSDHELETLAMLRSISEPQRAALAEILRSMADV